MENASKALYIAGSTLVAIGVMMLLIYLFRVGAKFGENYENQKSIEQIEAFNARFEVYAKTTVKSGGEFLTKGNTITEVISAANLAYSINKKNNWDSSNGVHIIVEISPTKVLEIPRNREVPKNNFFYGTKTIKFDELMGKRLKDVENLLASEEYKLTDAKRDETLKEVIYRYYFDVNPNSADGIRYNERGLVDQVRFKMNGPNYIHINE